MALVIAKVLTLYLVPFLPPAIWKIRTRSPWACVMAGLGAAALYGLAKRPLRTYIHYNDTFGLDRVYPDPPFDLFHVGIALMYATASSVIIWAVMRATLSNVKTWRGAVLFGMTQVTLAAFVSINWQIERMLLFTAMDSGFAGQTTSRTTFEILRELPNIPTHYIITNFDQNFRWTPLLTLLTFHTVEPILLHTGLAVAILYTVKSKKVWPLAAAILCLTLSNIIDTNFSTFFLFNYIRNSPEIGNIYTTIFSFLHIDGFLRQNLSYWSIGLLPGLLAALPAFGLGLLARKALTNPTDK